MIHRSLALTLGLLSAGINSIGKRISRNGRGPLLHLLLVPHTELARQYEYWLSELQDGMAMHRSALHSSGKLTERSPDGPEGQEIAQMDNGAADTLPTPVWQVLYRGAEETAISPMTRMLVATPNALLDALTDHPFEQFADIHTIALDEADDMMSLPSRFAARSELHKWERHPPLLISLMKELLTQDGKHSQPESAKTLPRRGRSQMSRQTKQAETKRLIAVSATANSVFRDWLVRRSGWIGSEGILGKKQIDWYDFSGQSQIDSSANATEYERIGQSLLPSSELQHILYRFDADGELVAPSSSQGDLRSRTQTVSGTTSASDRLSMAVATLVAYHEISNGLLLIPSGMSATTLIEQLRALDVPATTVSEGLIQRLEHDEARLYVQSVNAVRGLDIPGLNHIIVGPGLVKDSQDYLHISGRVGRMTPSGERRRGQVLCLAKAESGRDIKSIQRAWDLLGISGTDGGVVDLAQI